MRNNIEFNINNLIGILNDSSIKLNIEACEVYT